MLAATNNGGIYSTPAHKVEYNYDIVHSDLAKGISALMTGVSPLTDRNPNMIALDELYSETELLLPDMTDVNKQYVLGVPSKASSFDNYRPIATKKLDAVKKPLYNPQNVIRTNPGLFEEEYI
ncbi:hypothetical protein SDC9_199031 [bioreactor metagenome]|uniref:Uncharacterized protein n=1 Tax=bioreactor metagenome TaxID=1076179 RepID=A0A645IJC5_9ZZZZ